MKKGFKITFYILMSLVFVFSALFNILVHSSSYGTLIIKHSDEKMINMVSTEALNLYPTYFLTQKNAGAQIHKESRENGIITKSTYKIHFDKNYNMTASIVEIVQGENYFIRSDSYYKNEQLYTETNDIKTKKASNPNVVTSTILAELYTLQNALVEDVESTKAKAIIDFSFSPFYVLGIRYTIKNDERSATYHYDLSGNLRKIEIKHKSGKTEYYELSYKAQKIKEPNLDEYR